MVSKSAILLSGAILIALSSGTIYVFSAYAPQLAAKFTLSSYQLNLLGGAGNAGAYLTGPAAGALVDRQGAQSALLSAALFTLAGYTTLLCLFIQPDETTRSFGQSYIKTGILILCQFCVGIGCSLGCVGATNAVAKGMSNSSRATSLAATYAGVGLSAFLYSTVAHTFFDSGSTAGLLGLLAAGSFISMLVGQVMIGRSFSALQYNQLQYQEEEEEDDDDMSELGDTALTMSASWQSNDSRKSAEVETRVEVVEEKADVLDISGKQLWRNIDFFILFTYGLIVLGTGLMYINNVGTQVTTLYASSTTEEVTQATISAKQAYFVTAISLSNCFGRIAFGATAERVQRRIHLNRTTWLFLAAACLLLGQLFAKWARAPKDLLLPSMLNGMAYGSFFGLSPVLIVEYFGLNHFSTNYGFLTVAPAASGPMLSSLFGLVYDSHVSPDAAERHLCLLGHDCYSAAFSITTLLSLFAMALAAVLTWRRGLWVTESVSAPNLCAH